jgi:DNA-binding CsgD family transcriptional regulator
VNKHTDATDFKHAFLSRLLEYRLPEWQKSERALIFVEPTSGSAMSDMSSPVILNKFLKTRWVRKGKYFAADDGFDVCDGQTKPAIGLLLSRLCELGYREQVIITNGKAEEYLPDARHRWQNEQGLVFVDPCGDFMFDAIKNIVGDAPYMDVLINIPCGGTVRVWEYNKVDDMIKNWPGRHWTISLENGRTRWVKLFGTTNENFDGISMGLFPIKDNFGRAILIRSFDCKYNKQNRSDMMKNALKNMKLNKAKYEVRVAELYKRGMTRKQIAECVGICSKTVSDMVRRAT